MPENMVESKHKEPEKGPRHPRSGSLKSEFFYLNKFDLMARLEVALQHCIHFYNHDRIRRN